MTLNGIMAVILRYFSEFGSFRGALHCVKVAEDIPKLSATEIAQSVYFLGNRLYKNSSGDEIANVNFCTTTTYM